MMPDEEKLRSYIDEVREAIRLIWKELASEGVTAETGKTISQHLEKCQIGLEYLQDRLDHYPKTLN
jgi:hypothetical protein